MLSTIQSQKKEHSPHHVLGFAFLFVFLFLFSCSLSRFSFRSCQLTNWVKGLEQSSKDKLHADEIGLLHEFLDHSSGGSRGGARGALSPSLFLTKLRPEGPKVFLRLCVLVVSICFTLRSSILSCAHITHTDLYNSVTLNNVNEW